MTAPRKRHRLTKLRIREVSLVDDGMNPESKVVLFKARSKGSCADCPSPDDCAAAGGCGIDAAFSESVAKAMGQPDPDERAAELLAAVEAGLKSLTGGFPVRKAAAAAGDSTMTLEELQAALTAAQTKLTGLEGDIAKGKVDLATRDATIATQKTEIETLTAAVAKAKGTQEPSEEEFLKSLPASVRKQLADAKLNQAVLDKMIEDSGVAVEVTKMRTMGVIEPDKMGAALFRVTKGKSTPEDAALIESALKSATAVAKGGNLLLKVVGGKDAGEADATDPVTILKGKATALRAVKPLLTEEQAFVEACAANPGLYAEYTKRNRLGVIGAMAGGE